MIEGKVVRAIDVGYGNVKYVRKHDNIEDVVECAMFPSIFVGASGEAPLGGAALGKRDTVIVKVDNSFYEVGKDIALGLGANEGKTNLTKDYIHSAGYMAGFLGALHYMFKEIEGDTIDYLIVGLPVTNMALKDYLINKLSGQHELPGNKIVHVKEVKVYEQPLGAFFNFLYSPAESRNLKFEDCKNESNLIIDPGMYTFDWMYIDQYKAVEKKSGSTMGSMSAVIARMAEAIAKDLGKLNQIDSIDRILRKAIREGKPVKIGQTEIELEKYVPYAQSVIDTSVETLAGIVGDAMDLNNVMLVGGGARFFLPKLQKVFKDHEIMTTKNAVYANVIGFQMSGERVALRDQVAERKRAIATA